jgi:hypothetical protein
MLQLLCVRWIRDINGKIEGGMELGVGALHGMEY